LNINPKAQSSSVHRGFTLIEVLIAILILALGLLGLGAVFPVVITQQRNAVAVVDGQSVASMAEAILTSSTEIIDFSEWFVPGNEFGRSGPAPTDGVTYEWVVPPFTPYNGYPKAPGFEGFGGSQDGRWFVELDSSLNSVNDITTVGNQNKGLTVADRLVPQPFSGKDPKYVWDVVARRQPGTNRPQLAIFIRHVDPRIRVPADRTLSDLLVVRGAAAGSNVPLLPVAIDSTTGLSTVDNKGQSADEIVYAAPQTLQVQVVSDHLDWLIIEEANTAFLDRSIGFAVQPGQKLLDNSGTVRTVIGPPPSDSSISLLNDTTVRVVRVDPPFNLKQAAVDATGYSPAANNPVSGDPNVDAQRASWIRQIVFTPRTPLAIRVITLEEVSP